MLRNELSALSELQKLVTISQRRRASLRCALGPGFHITRLWRSSGFLKKDMADRIVIWGASGHALVVADIVRVSGTYELVGFLDDLDLSRHQTDFHGIPILGGTQQLDSLRKSGIEYLTVGVGDCAARLKLAEVALEKGFSLARAIHPRAIIAADVEMGPGTVVAGGAVINPGCRIGSNVIINTCASVDHECVIEAGAHIGPGVNLGGKVTVGMGSWIGIGANVRDGVVVGDRSIIGAGAVVLRDVAAESVAFGVPAKVQRKIAPDD
jgi:UDP-N-acetylbacillosamine N-acetyltransferase